MSENILNVNERVYFDESIQSVETRTYQPYASTLLNNNDEIRISIQRQDLFTLPSNSFIYIEGQLLTHDNKATTKGTIVNNGIMHLFDEIRYKIGGIVIERIRNPGFTTTLKSYCSYSKNDCISLQNACWSPHNPILQ